MNPPSGEAIVEKDMLEGIETTFDKFNTFLDALARFGVTQGRRTLGSFILQQSQQNQSDLVLNSLVMA